MFEPLTGVVVGNTIALDAPSPVEEGTRVRVILEPLAAAEPELPWDEQRRLWQGWIESGPQGPIEEEGGAEFP